MSRDRTRSNAALRRAWLWGALAAIVAVAVAACGGSSSGSGGGGGGSSSQQKVKLVYFNARQADPAEQALVKKYMQEHPNVTISYQSSTQSGIGGSDTNAIASLTFNVQAHNEIDLAKVEVTRTPLELARSNAAVNLNKIDASAVKSQLSQLLATNMVSFANGVWALPYENDPFGLVYNGAMFQQAGIKSPPKTWDQWRQDNKALKQKFPNAWPVCLPINNLAKTQPLVWGAGGTYWDRDILPTKANFQNQGIKDGYSFIQEWSQNGWMNNSELTTTNATQWMVSRKCASEVYSANSAQTLAFNDPSTDWKVATLPAKDSSHKPTNFVGGSALMVPSTAKYPKAALDFARWLTSHEGQNLKYGVDKSLGLTRQDIGQENLPANKTTVQQVSQDPNWKQALATANVPTRVSGISPAYSKAYQLLADMQERILLKHTNVDQELAATQQQVQQLLDQASQQNPQLYSK